MDFVFLAMGPWRLLHWGSSKQRQSRGMVGERGYRGIQNWIGKLYNCNFVSH